MTGSETQTVLSIHSDGQIFGLSVERVVHVLKKLDLAPVPGTPPMIAGLINLRGHMIVALDLRAVLDQPERVNVKVMGVIIETPSEPVCLVVDAVGEVLELSHKDQFEAPQHIPERYLSLAENFYRQDDDILIKLDEVALVTPTRLAA